jgi:hypothetical protein
MRYGGVTAFLANSSIHGDLLAHAKAIRQFLQYDPRGWFAASEPVIQKLAFGSHCNLSSRTTRLRIARCFQNGGGTDAISDQSILRWRFAVCELVYIHARGFLTGMSLVGTWRTSQVQPRMSAIGAVADVGMANAEVCFWSRSRHKRDRGHSKQITATAAVPKSLIRKAATNISQMNRRAL